MEAKINKADVYFQKYAHEVIQVDAFSAGKIGLIQAQTVLKIDKLQLVCTPFQISMQRAILICVLNERELPYFIHYKEKLTSLKLTFNKSDFVREPLKLMIWTKINQIIPLKGRQDICMIDLSYKNNPADLIEILGNYLDFCLELKGWYVRYKNKMIPINPETSKRLKFNNYVEATINNKTTKAKLLAFAVNSLVLILPAVDQGIQKGVQFETKLFFQKYRFSVKGVVAQLLPAPDRLIKLVFSAQFTLELVELIHDYFLLNP